MLYLVELTLKIKDTMTWNNIKDDPDIIKVLLNIIHVAHTEKHMLIYIDMSENEIMVYYVCI